MSLHDSYARITPFEVAFPDARDLAELSDEIRDEAARRGVSVSDPHAFLTLGSVARGVERLRATDAGPQAATRFSALLFHAVHFADAGRPLYLVETPVARRLVDQAAAGAPDPPSPAGYLQLPQHLFWVGEPDGDVPESIDGAFWTQSAGGLLHVLLAAGLRPDRPGFGAFPLPEAPLADATEWLRAHVREAEADFRSALEGSEIDALYSIRAAGEALKLLARFFAYASSASAGIERGLCATDVREDGPRPSALPYARVRLVA